MACMRQMEPAEGYQLEELDAELDEALDQALGLSSSPMSSSPMSEYSSYAAQPEQAPESPARSYSPAPHDSMHAQQQLSTSGQLDDSQQQQPQQQQQHQQQRSERRVLEGLPREVFMRVCSFLSAHDLTTAAQSSRLLARLCSEPVLWRRLFCARWGATKQPSAPTSWKAMYIERDLAELQEELNRAPEPLKDMFVEMQLAKRQRALGRSAADDDLLLADDTMAARVNTWRRSRGFGPVQPRRPKDLAGRSYHVIGDYFCDNATGWVHLCDDTCVEQVVDRPSGLMVCVVSGRMSHRMVEVDADDEDDDEAAGGQLGGAQEELGWGGHLARAFCEGWDCADEQELEQRCGVRLSP